NDKDIKILTSIFNNLLSKNQLKENIKLFSNIKFSTPFSV
ncbi:unnamed protein product, partial [marine sediment metagenome]